jgi:hypothetical protein
MNGVTLGLIISGILVIVYIVLLRYEAKHSMRFLLRARAYADFYVLKCMFFVHRMLRLMGKDTLLQVGHYVFHTLLRSVLHIVRSSEDALRNMMRVNKTLAKRAEKESVTQSKLEAIALHKAETALTEEEKRERREKILEGF